MRTEIKILKFLIAGKKRYTIRELSKRIGADYKIVHTAVNKLLKKCLLRKRTVGNAIEVEFVAKFSKEVFEAELERREETFKDRDISTMINIIKRNLDRVNFILLLFGSYAKGSSKKGSDIDLMFIVPNEEMIKSVERAVTLIPLPIHSQIFTENEFRKGTFFSFDKFNVIKEVVRDNIILHGIEQYYELIKDVG